MTEWWYRYQSHRRAAPVDEYGDSVGRGTVELSVFRFKVLKETPKGVWLDNLGQRRFVLRAARKRFACPTKAEALESCIARLERRVIILQAQMEDSNYGIYLAKKELARDDKEGIEGGDSPRSLPAFWL